MSQTNDKKEVPAPTNEELVAKFLDGDGNPTGLPDKKEEEKAEETSQDVENKEETGDEDEEKAPDTDESAESGADAPEDGEEKAEEGKDAAKKKKKSAEERIAEFRRKQGDAERAAEAKEAENAELRRRLEELEGKKQDKDLTDDKSDTKSEDNGPDPYDFEYGEVDPRYVSALAEHKAAKIVEKTLAEQRKKDEEARQSSAADAKRQELASKMDAHIEAGIKEFEDFETAIEALQEIDTPIAPETTEALLQSEFAPQILHHLGKNPEEAREMASKSPIEQARYLGKLEAKFSASKAAPEKPKASTSKAPPPPQRARGANGQFQADDATMNFSDFKARHAGKGF